MIVLFCVVRMRVPNPYEYLREFGYVCTYTRLLETRANKLPENINSEHSDFIVHRWCSTLCKGRITVFELTPGLRTFDVQF